MRTFLLKKKFKKILIMKIYLSEYILNKDKSALSLFKQLFADNQQNSDTQKKTVYFLYRFISPAE